MRTHQVWIVGGRRADGTWIELDRLSGPGRYVEALSRVAHNYYRWSGSVLVFTPTAWKHETNKTQG